MEGHPHNISYLTQRIHSFILDMRIGLAWRVCRGSRFYSCCYGGEEDVICTWMPYYFVVTKTAVIAGLCPMGRILYCCRDETREETSAMSPWGIRVWICGEVRMIGSVEGEKGCFGWWVLICRRKGRSIEKCWMMEGLKGIQRSFDEKEPLGFLQWK
jgi:hypothetical protein